MSLVFRELKSVEEFEDNFYCNESAIRKCSTIQSKFFGPVYMNNALSDRSWLVVYVAVRSKFFCDRYMNFALNYDSDKVNNAAKLSNSHGFIRYLDDLMICAKVDYF